MTLSWPAWPRTAPLAAAAACGVLIVVNPVAGTAAAAITVGVTLAVAYASSLPRAFLRCAALLLVGYAMFGRGFAYLGAPPLFVGEGTLGLGMIASFVAWSSRMRSVAAVLSLVLAFVLLGALRTVPFIPVYGTDALRDAVVWGYSLYAVIVAAAVLHTGWLENVPPRYEQFVRLFVWWVPFAWAMWEFRVDSIPTVPGASTPLLSFKAGDAAVHLGGAAAFVFAGLGSWRGAARGMRGRIAEFAFWTGWAISFGVTASFNRGGMMAIFAATGLALALGGRAAGLRALRAVAVATAIGASFVALDAAGVVGAIRPPGEVRALSVEQLGRNLASVVGSENDRVELEGTKRWRLEWWNAIIGYTVHGRYFWTGKGFGVNLASDDGFQLDADETLRSPHNGHMSILARMGIPGVTLWAVLQLTYAACLLRTHLRARRRSDALTAGMSAWLLAYWAAFMVNMSFDVYLEGPQGGIWMWSTMGLGIALVARDRQPDRIALPPAVPAP